MERQERIYFLHFAAESDALLKLKEGDSFSIPTNFVTLAGGLSLQWSLKLYPRGKDGNGDFRGSVCLAEEWLRPSVSTRSRLQLKDERGRFGDLGTGHWSCFGDWVTRHRQAADRQPDMVPGGRVEGRWVVVVDVAALVPGVLAETRIAAFKVPIKRQAELIHGAAILKTPETNAVMGKLLAEGLAGDAGLCDSVLLCADGELRAASCVLRADNAFFSTLYGFKERQGKEDLTLELKAHSVAVVGAVLHLLHGSALPPLGDWGLAELGSLLELSGMVFPGGHDLLLACAEKTLLGLMEEAELGELVAVADLHGLRMLGNVALVRVASAPTRCYRKFGSFSFIRIPIHGPITPSFGATVGARLDWDAVDRISMNRDTGAEYIRPEA